MGAIAFQKPKRAPPKPVENATLDADHPQIEVYNESKHGIIYHAKVNEMNLESDKWEAGIDYFGCSHLCHVSYERWWRGNLRLTMWENESLGLFARLFL